MNIEQMMEFESIADELMRSPNCERGIELAKLLRNPTNLRQVYLVFTSTNNRYLQYLCLSSVLVNISEEWKNFTVEDKTFLYENLFTFLTDSSEKPGFLVLANSKLLARVCRLGWIELEPVRKAIERILDFSKQGVNQNKIASKFFFELIQEINEPIKYRSIVINRKVIVKFRDEALLKILEHSLSNINNTMNSVEFIVDNLNILSQALNYDFSGSNNEEGAEESNILAIPLNWKTVLCQKDLFVSLEKFFFIENEELLFLSFKVLNQLCGIRKTAFLKLDEKITYCSYLYSIFQVLIQLFLRNPSLFSNDSYFPLFLQGIKRFFSNFLIRELSEHETFLTFLNSFLSFSIEIFKNPSLIFNINKNTIQVWSFLSYEGVSQTEKIKSLVPVIFENYLDFSFQSLRPEIFDPNNESDLMELLDNLNVFSTYFYPDVLNILNPRLNQIFSNLESGNPLPGHISWSVYLCSCMLSNPSKKIGQDLDDKLVEILAGIVPKIINLGGYVEKSVIYFCSSFNSAYLSSNIDSYWGDADSLLSQATIGDISLVVIEVIFKCFNSYSSGDVLNKALELFEKLCSGYYSTKIIASLPSTFSLINYPVCNFVEGKMRKLLFQSLAQLWTADYANLSIFFDLVSQKIKACIGNRVETAKLFVELTGISKALNTEKLYKEFFEVISEDIWNVVSFYKQLNGDLEPFKPLFIFFIELTENRNNRIKFESSEAYGIILFKNLYEIISIFCDIKEESELGKVSKIKTVLRLVNNLLRGNLVSFGIFEVYNDLCYVNTIIKCFQLIINSTEIQRYPKVLVLIFELFDILCKSHQKTILVSSPEYCLSSILSFFIYAFKSDGLYFSYSNAIIVNGSLNYLFEYIFKTLKKNNQLSSEVIRVLQRETYKFDEIFDSIIEITLNQDTNLMWAINKVLLEMTIIFEDRYHRIKSAAINKFSDNFETRQKLEDSFSKLFMNIDKSLDTKNKDAYTKNFTEFKQTLSNLSKF